MKRTILHLFLLGMIAVILFGCSKNKGTDEKGADFSWVKNLGEGEFPGVNPLEVRGDVITAGSSTVAPLASVLVERYKQDGMSQQITIDVIGTGAGFERWAKNGETDVSNASRKIKDSEVESAKAIGREPIEFRIGSDALSVVVSHENTFITDVTRDELAVIFGSAQKWSDVNSRWPDEPIRRYIPGTDSGTFDFFVEMIFDEDPSMILSADNTQFSEDDNILVQGIEGSPYSIGFFGYAYYHENMEKLNLVSIEGIVPSQATVDKSQYDSFEKNLAAGGYPIARPLFIYSDAKIMQTKPQVAAYVAYFLNNVNDVIDNVGYFPADLTASKQKWLEAMKGLF